MQSHAIVVRIIFFLFVWISVSSAQSNDPVVAGEMVYLCTPGAVVSEATVDKHHGLTVSNFHVMDLIFIHGDGLEVGHRFFS